MNEEEFEKWIKKIYYIKGEKINKIKIKKLLEKRNFKKNFKIINVVGTNGKGSVSEYINKELIKQKFKVGKFTSPHLLKFNERITINNKEITNKEFYDLLNPFLSKYKKNKLFWFTIIYIIAMIYFYKNNVDIVILEAGIGGNKDATSTIIGDWSILTSIGEDHMEFFKTKKNLCLEKIKITQKNMKCFLPSVLKNKEKKIILNYLKTNKIKYKIINNKSIDYEIRNQKLVNGFIKEITNKEIKKFPKILGRTTIKKINNKTVIYDVAHNEAGIKSSWKKIKKNKIKIEQIVISLSKYKNDKKIMKIFKQIPIFIYEHKGMKPKKIKHFKIKGQKIENIKDFQKKIEKNTLFIGSFYLISELLQKKDKKNNDK